MGLTMFGVTTPCVQQISVCWLPRFDCLGISRHRHGRPVHGKAAGGRLSWRRARHHHDRSLRSLVRGVLACTDDRFGAVARTRAPYFGSCGALDMVNFGAPETVPATLSRAQVVSSITRRSR